MKMLNQNVIIVVPWHNSNQIERFKSAWNVTAKEDEELVLFFEDAGGYGCARAKNDGVKHAVEDYDADIVVILDDDCYPVKASDLLNRGMAGVSHHQLAGSLTEFAAKHVARLEERAAVEIFSHITTPKSRGTPILQRTAAFPVAASIGFWLGMSDYSAVDELSAGKQPMKFDSRPMFNRHFAMSGMNIAFKPREWLPWCSFIDVPRYDDIWMGLLWQKEAYRRGYCFSFDGPLVNHAKQSNPFNNLIEEAKYLEANETVWRKIFESKHTEYDELRKLLPC